MEEKKWCVYLHTNKINNKKYVGITCQKPETRWGYGCNYHYKKYRTKFSNAIKKYGWDNFDHEILEDNIPTLEEANKKEQYYIELYDSFKNGYNSTIGGDGVKGCTPWNKGIPCSEEVKEKNRIKHIGKKASKETREKISKSHKGLLKGRKQRPEVVEARRQKQIGKRIKGRHIILQYDLQGNFIREYIDAVEASTKLNIDISNILKVCNGKRNKAGGYVWRFA